MIWTFFPPKNDSNLSEQVLTDLTIDNLSINHRSSRLPWSTQVSLVEANCRSDWIPASYWHCLEFVYDAI